jgi:uncharacterized protein (DUF2147 family)
MRHDHPSSRSRFPFLFMGISGLLVSATLGLSSSAPAAGGASELGLWYNDAGKGAIEIRPCATSGRDANKLCGVIVWLKEPNFKNGKPLTDGYNSDPSKRHRPICGLPVLGGLQRVSEGGYDNGWVYDPEQGQAFDAAIQLRTADRLILTGYKGIKFFSKSFVWKRAPADLPRCDGNTTARDVKSTVGAAQPTAPAKAKVAAPAQPTAADKAKVAITPTQPPAADKAKVAVTPTQPATPEKVASGAPVPGENVPVATVARASAQAQTDVLVPPRPVPAVRPPHPPIE